MGLKLKSATVKSILGAALMGVFALSDGVYAVDAVVAPAAVDYAAANEKLVQEIKCGEENKDLLFMEYPADASKVEDILGAKCRVLSNSEGDHKYFAYRVGEGKGLKAGAMYRLEIQYPEDHARTIHILNWGCETALGFATGQALGDVMKGKYVPNSPESLKYPLSGKMETWNQVFNLHDRFPEIKRPRGLFARSLTPDDGFWVIFAQQPAFQDPLGAGTAVATIRLYEIQKPESLALKLNPPPAGLPRRHIATREEMADNAVGYGHKPEEQSPINRGVKNIPDWYEYKIHAMKFLGIDTFTKDLLEFGHNQGWDSADGGGDAWVNQSSTPKLWEQILALCDKYKVNVLPYYEYRGSIGQNKEMSLGVQHRSRRLDGGETYTNISWCEGTNVDITDPDTLADTKKLLDISMLKFKKDVPYVGAWFRQRPTAMPVSFNEKNFKMFSAEVNGGKRITRAHLQGDKALLDKYYAWWFGKRRAYFDAVADYVKKQVGPDAYVLYTNDSSEPGRSLSRSITGEGKPNGWEWMQVVVNDDMSTWSEILSRTNEEYKFMKPYSFDEVVDKNMHARSLATWTENWGEWESNHSTPPDDPQDWKNADGAMLTYTYNRLYTVSNPEALASYTTKDGLALVRHYSLNENEMSVGNEELTGYFIVDVERAGPYCMMAEARAIANGDPRFLGSLDGNSCQKGFPQYVRPFYAAYISLPALPSTVLKDASSDPEVVVREIKTPKNGTYYAIVNTGFGAKEAVTITLPAKGAAKDSATNEAVKTDAGKMTVTLYPAQLRAIHVQ